MESHNLNGKIYKFNDRADFIFYLAELISELIRKTDTLKLYQKEIQLILKNNPKAKLVNSEIYETISDKTNRVFSYLFNLIGDESKKAFSYRKFRKILYKKKSELKIVLEKLPQEEAETIGQFNQLRNWGLHIPESIFLQKRRFLKIDSKFILANKKTIPVPTYEYFEIKFLSELNKEIQGVLDGANQVLKRMKDDYSKLIGEELVIEYEINQVKPYVFMKAVENSWQVQTGKLK